MCRVGQWAVLIAIVWMLFREITVQVMLSSLQSSHLQCLLIALLSHHLYYLFDFDYPTYSSYHITITSAMLISTLQLPHL